MKFFRNLYENFLHQKSFHTIFATGLECKRSERRKPKGRSKETNSIDSPAAILRERYQGCKDGRHRIDTLNIEAHHL